MTHGASGEQTPAAFQDANGKLMLSDRFGRLWRVSERKLSRAGKMVRCRAFEDGAGVERIYCLRRGELIDTTVTGLMRQLESSELAGTGSASDGIAASNVDPPSVTR